MFIDDALVAQYYRDGYVLLENVYSEREVAAILYEVEYGQRVADKAYGRSDSTGKSARLALWHELGDDIGALANPQSAGQKMFEQRPCPISAADAMEQIAEGLFGNA